MLETNVNGPFAVEVAPVGAIAAMCDAGKTFLDMVWRLCDFGTEQYLRNGRTGEIVLVHQTHSYGAKPVFEGGPSTLEYASVAILAQVVESLHGRSLCRSSTAGHARCIAAVESVDEDTVLVSDGLVLGLWCADALGLLAALVGGCGTEGSCWDVAALSPLQPPAVSSRKAMAGIERCQV